MFVPPRSCSLYCSLETRQSAHWSNVLESTAPHSGKRAKCAPHIANSEDGTCQLFIGMACRHLLKSPRGAVGNLRFRKIPDT